MKIGIFSDTHDRLESVEKAVKFLYAFGKITNQKTIALYETKINQGKILNL